MKKVLLFFGCFISTMLAFGQQISVQPSVRSLKQSRELRTTQFGRSIFPPNHLLTYQKKEKNLKFIFYFDNRRSFLASRPVKINGLRLGLEFFRKYRIGAGIYFAGQPIPLQPIDHGSYITDQSLHFGYNTAFFEYVIYQDFRWELSVPVQLGGGTARVDTISSKFNEVGTLVSGRIPVVTANAAAHYKIFYWLGIGAGVGYRVVITENDNVRRSLTAPFYVIKAKLFFGDLYRAIFKREQVREEREEYKQMKAERRAKRKKRREERRGND